MKISTEAGGGEHGVDAVAISAFEIIATHPMIVIEMADHGFDGGATALLEIAPSKELQRFLQSRLLSQRSINRFQILHGRLSSKSHTVQIL